jgi:hypothetical protein
MNQDLEHLRLLSIFHYIMGGIMAFFACIPLIHVTLGLALVFVPKFFENQAHHSGAAPPVFIGWLFIVLGGAFVLLGWTVAVLTFLAGRNLAHRRRPTFCFVVACLMCAWVPFGTVLGVFTIIVLSRPTVKTLFQTAPAP